MTYIYWAWGAVLADLAIFLNPLVLSSSMSAFISVLVAHSSACAVVAVSTYLLLPARFKQPRTMVLLLMFGFAFIAPIVGAIGMLLITRTTLREGGDGARLAVPASVALPEYDVQMKSTHRGGRGAIRSRLEANVPNDLRMQSLLTLQAVSSRVSNPILEELLGDNTDDVRLVAFGMLDAEEKKLSGHIQRERIALSRELTPEQRYACFSHLAELHWELIYTALAQGDLRRHMLGQANHYVEEALDTGMAPESGLLFLKGRMLLNQGELEAADVTLQLSMDLGKSKTSVLPYLAEIAFKQRDFDHVRQIMQELASLNLASKTRAVEVFWAGHANAIDFNDRQYLPHL